MNLNWDWNWIQNEVKTQYFIFLEILFERKTIEFDDWLKKRWLRFSWQDEDYAWTSKLFPVGIMTTNPVTNFLIETLFWEFYNIDKFVKFTKNEN